jgi:ketosteroid isomerase-like protein
MRRAAAGALLITLAELAGCKSAPAPLTAADRATAQTIDSAFSVAFAASDVAGMTAAYAPDAMLLPPNMPMAKGMDQIHTWMQAMASQKGTIQLLQETADGAGDFMYTTGRYHIQMLPAEAGVSEDGKYLQVFRRGTDGKWMLAAEGWSANAPAAPMAPAKPAAPRHAK